MNKDEPNQTGELCPSDVGITRLTTGTTGCAASKAFNLKKSPTTMIKMSNHIKSS